MRKLMILGFSLSLLVIVSAATSVPQGSAQIDTVNQYAAKFVCGKTDGPLAAPGQYFTIINVHNPSANPSVKNTVKIKKKFALGEKDERAGKISSFCETLIKPDEVIGIDCPNIYRHLNIPEGTFIEGFAVIQAAAELDVVSVYTAGHQQVEAFHTERVPFRKVARVCSPLNLNISTGSSLWRITSDPLSGTTEPRAASVLSVTPSFGSLPGAMWIGPVPNSGLVPVSRGTYVYEYEFCLCSNFSNVKLDLKGIVDDNATVLLNGVLLSPTLAGSGSADVKTISASSPFVAGTNTLRVVVTNSLTSITGLAITGSITATAGSCSDPACGE